LGRRRMRQGLWEEGEEGKCVAGTHLAGNRRRDEARQGRGL
jgi:hypothetical protein